MPIQAAWPQMDVTMMARMVDGIVIAVQMRAVPVSLSAPRMDASTMPNCTAARNAGAASVRRGEPGYGAIWTEITTAWVVSSRG